MPTLTTPTKHAHKKPLCEEIGHAWESTTSPNFRQCTRSSCRLVQHLHNGQWVKVRAKAHKQTVEQTHESLWG
jgi:hypothetical protein